MMASAMVLAQLNLKVTVHCSEPGTLFVKIQEQIEEIGELSDIGELTISGVLNKDDYNVINNQIKNITLIDMGGVTNNDETPICLKEHQKLTTAVLPSGITTLVDYCFYNCSSLESITLPDAITTIPVQCFRRCGKLTSVHLPAQLQTIKQGAFMESGLTSFTLPAGVKLDGSDIFGSCGNLESFIFPDGLKTSADVGTSTFSSCRKLKSVRLPQDLEEIPSGFFAYTALEAVDLPATVTKIGSQAFYGMTSPKRIVLPDGITEVGGSAFYLNKGVEEVVWPKSCHIIRDNMFRYASNLKSITIPETVDSIQGNAFWECRSLTSVHLPDGIRYLSYCLFDECNGLSEVNIPDSCVYIDGFAFYRCKFTHIDIPDAVTFIGKSAFEGTPLEEVNLPSKIRVIEGGAFAWGNYQHATVPEGCLYIGATAFMCNSLQTLDLPSSLLFVSGPLMNAWTPQIESVTIRATLPPYCGDDNFFGKYDKDRATLCVPAASLALYKQDSRYSSNANAIEAISPDVPLPGVLNVTGDVVISDSCGLQTDKFDVNFIQQELNKDMFAGHFYYDHPRLTISPGATFHAGTMNMTFDRNDYHPSWYNYHERSNYSWDVFINQGTCTADQIDLRWRLADLSAFTPAFDVRLSDITPEREGAPYAFYRFDPSARAVGDFDGSWIRMGNNETLQAGVGYLYRARPMVAGYDDYNRYWYTAWVYQHHRSYPGGKNYFITSQDITLPMTHAAGEFEHNKNWNLVGQPYPAFFDIRGIDYDGPILLPNNQNGRRWNAYSPLDDEVVLEPMQAFFIQVPDGVNSITLDADRRQTSSKFVKGETTTSARALRRADQQRQRVVYDLSLAPLSPPEGGTIDPALETIEAPSGAVGGAFTRFVINPATTMRYDIGHDAPAMAADSCNLLYTYQNGVAYAINERPLDDGIVRLGLQVAEAGDYTLSLRVRGEAFPASEDVWLIDNETNTRTQLLRAVTEACPYTFTVTNPATLSSRFVIAIGDADPTAITETEATLPQRMEGIFNLSGQRVSQPRQGLIIKDGRIMFNK